MGEHGVASAAVDARGLVVAWSAGARRVLGYDHGEVIGRRAVDLLAAALPASARSRLAEPADWRGPVHARHRDGHGVELELEAHPLVDSAGESQWFLTATVPEPAVRLRRWALDQLPVPIALFDQDGLAVSANSAMEGVMGRPQEDLLGRRVGESADGRRRLPGFEGLDDAVRRVLRTGEPMPYEAWLRAPGESGEHAWLVSLSPLKDGTGEVRGMCLAAIDSTEQFLARRRLSMLNESGSRIGSTLDVTRTAEELAEVCTDHLADFVVVDLLDSVLAGEEATPSPGADPLVFRRSAQRSVLEGCPEAVIPVGSRHTYVEGSPPGRALTTGSALLYKVDDVIGQLWAAGSQERARSIEVHGIHSMMAVPLRARGITLGLSILSRHRTAEPFDEDDLLLAEELAARAAVCVDNARRYTRERAIALALQRSLLPQPRCPGRPPSRSPPATSRPAPAPGSAATGSTSSRCPGPGWHWSWATSSATACTPPPPWAGSAPPSAPWPTWTWPPDELLTQLDDLVLRLDPSGRPDEAEDGGEPGEIGATCLYAVYDPVSRRCTMARAGHPPPALVSPDGDAEFLDLPAGPPLGVGGLPFETAEIDLPEGSVLALYTDGLVEAGRPRPGRRTRAAAPGPARRRPPPGGDLRRTSLRSLLHGPARRRRGPAPGPHPGAGRRPGRHLGGARRPRVRRHARKLACDQLAAWGLDEVSLRHRARRQRAGHQRHPVRRRPHPAASDPRRPRSSARSPTPAAPPRTCAGPAPSTRAAAASCSSPSSPSAGAAVTPAPARPSGPSRLSPTRSGTRSSGAAPMTVGLLDPRSALHDAVLRCLRCVPQ